MCGRKYLGGITVTITVSIELGTGLKTSNDVIAPVPRNILHNTLGVHFLVNRVDPGKVDVPAQGEEERERERERERAHMRMCCALHSHERWFPLVLREQRDECDAATLSKTERMKISYQKMTTIRTNKRTCKLPPSKG